MTLLACVPNVSEGRDARVIRALTDAAGGAGARLVDVHSDVDHHRSVFTLLGAPDEVVAAALALGRAAVRLIDLRHHRGVHPRVGAIDVVPFVPLSGAPMDEAVAVARHAGEALAAEARLPVFFYAEAASRPERRDLPAIRLGGFERLAERMRDPEWTPDAGPGSPHPTAGAAVVGARPPLVAFNVVLDTADVAVARSIANRIRESGGGMPAVRAMGFFLASRGRTQVSLNLLDARVTSPRDVAARLAAEAKAVGARVVEHELVGCARADLFDDWPASLAPLVAIKPTQLLDVRLFA